MSILIVLNILLILNNKMILELNVDPKNNKFGKMKRWECVINF